MLQLFNIPFSNYKHKKDEFVLSFSRGYAFVSTE